MFTRKLSAVVALAVALALSSVVQAAEKQYFAHLEGTRLEPRANGRALWMITPVEVHLSVGVDNVAFDDAALVFVDDMLIGGMDIIKGKGDLHFNIPTEPESMGQFPRVRPGTPVEIYGLDGGLILHGTFRKFPAQKPVHKVPVDQADPADAFAAKKKPVHKVPVDQADPADAIVKPVRP
jgi:hypothetical protein